MVDFWPRVVFHAPFQFEDHIIKSNYALNFIIFDIMLAVSFFCMLCPSSLSVSTFPGESASHHLWVWASLFYFLFISFFFFCVSQCFGIVYNAVTSIVSADTSLGLMSSGHWGEEVVAHDWGKKTSFNSCRFCRSPGSVFTWAHSFGGAAQEITHPHPLSLE